MSVLAGCAVAPGSNQIGPKGGASAQASQIPSGYIDVERFSQQQLGMYAASLWVKQAPTSDERFSRGMRAFADLRKEYFERLNAGLSAVETKNILAAKVTERANREYLAVGTKGLALAFRDATYSVSIANYRDPSGKLEVLVGGHVYGYKLPEADIVLKATTSHAKPLGRNLLAISDSMKFQGQRVRDIVSIETPRVLLDYAVPKEQFAMSLFENRKKGQDTVLTTSGYLLFELYACYEDSNFDRLACKAQLVSNNVASPTLTTQRAGR